MEIITSLKDMQRQADRLRCDGKRIGLVPTMGFLHEGHLSLLDLARQHSDISVMSLFVNPTQFGPQEDLSAYPRDFQRDEALAHERGCDFLFHPNEAEVYAAPFRTTVSVDGLTTRLCGASRPGHFRGVTTIVTKLFNIIRPHVAVFGQKDAQQGLVIRQMVRDLNMDIEILLGAIVREADGLAMSSRNDYLSPKERKDARVLFQGLAQARDLFESGEVSAPILKSRIAKTIASAATKVDYIELVDTQTLDPVKVAKKGSLIALAVWVGKTRLIDNLIL